MTNYRVVLHAKAVEELRALPKKLKGKAKVIVDGLALNPFPQTAARLKGHANAYRIRLNDYRILYEVHATEIVVYVVGVAHRKEVYLRLLRRL